MFEKEIKHLLAGGCVVGKSEDLFALFLSSFVRSEIIGPVLFVSNDDSFNKDQYVSSTFFNNEIFYYPDPVGGAADEREEIEEARSPPRRPREEEVHRRHRQRDQE